MQAAQTRKFSLKDILFMPVGCLLSLSPAILAAALAVTALVGSYVYYFVNVDFFGLGAPPFEDLVISPDFNRIDQADGSYLTISFEKPQDSVFGGLVRHISPIRLGNIPILTHDIMVTSGDFADPQRVRTSVSNHRFTWFSAEPAPRGTIHLLHTVPINETVYKQLLDLSNGQNVRITGREILKIDAYTAQGESKGWWQDTGCNTLIVTSIEVISP